MPCSGKVGDTTTGCTISSLQHELQGCLAGRRSSRTLVKQLIACQTPCSWFSSCWAVSLECRTAASASLCMLARLLLCDQLLLSAAGLPSVGAACRHSNVPQPQPPPPRAVGPDIVQAVLQPVTQRTLALDASTTPLLPCEEWWHMGVSDAQEAPCQLP